MDSIFVGKSSAVGNNGYNPYIVYIRDDEGIIIHRDRVLTMVKGAPSIEIVY